MKNFIFNILACPRCKNRLIIKPQRDIFCKNCSSHYKFKGNLPFLLTPESQKYIQDDLKSQTGQKMINRYGKKIMKIINFLRPPSPLLHFDNSRIMKIIATHNGEKTKVLSIGGGGKEPKRFPTMINLNIDAFPNVDIIGDAHNVPLLDNSLDGIICNAVLEHLRDPYLAVKEMRRILKRGGYVYTEVPFIQPYHGYPRDYQRYTLFGLENLFSFEGFSKIESGVVSGPSSTISHLTRDYLSSLFPNKNFQIFIKDVAGWILFPLKYLDVLLNKRNDHSLASGVYFFGRKT